MAGRMRRIERCGDPRVADGTLDDLIKDTAARMYPAAARPGAYEPLGEAAAVRPKAVVSTQYLRPLSQSDFSAYAAGYLDLSDLRLLPLTKPDLLDYCTLVPHGRGVRCGAHQLLELTR